MNNLAGLYRDMNRLDEAETLFRKALDIRTNVLGSSNPLIAKTLMGMAELSAKRHDYDNAEQLLERAISIQRKTLGDDHPDLATTFNMLGNVYLAPVSYTHLNSVGK